jgi:hypothetical protein
VWLSGTHVDLLGVAVRERRFSARARSGLRACLFVVVSAVVASTIPASSHPDPVEPSARPPVTVAADEAAAMAAAVAQGTRVEIGSLRSETTQVFANPTGTLTMDQAVQPVRALRDGRWVDIDTSLERTTDGLIAPRATAVPVSFSAGGSGPFARITAPGVELALSWPHSLPAPTMAGDTATYPDVLPGVDLRVRAGFRGFGHELVVRNRQAAANPDLAKITFGLSVVGARLTADDAGNLSGRNEAGATVFAAPAPLMWDTAPPQASPDAEAPPRTERPVGLQLTDGLMSLIPDQKLLTDPGARFPIVIDPQFSFHTPNAGSSWTLVRQSHPDAKHWNLAPRDDDETTKGVARIGHAPGWAASYLDRSLFQFDTSPIGGSRVIAADFKIYQVWKYAHTCDPNLIDPMTLYRTDGINSNTTWNSQPAWREALSSARSVPKIGYCSPDWVGMDAAYAFQLAANGGWSTVTLGLRANNEGGDDGWKRFFVQSGTVPHVTITYNRRPTVTEVDTEPRLTPCGWCEGVAYFSGSSINLKGRVNDPDGGTVTARWTIRRPPFPVESRAQELAAGSVFATAVDTSRMVTGHEVSWDFWGDDGNWPTDPVARPRFIVDNAAPLLAPEVSGVLYQGDNRWHGGVGVVDTFTFRPRLALRESNDIDHYLWGWTDPPSNVLPAAGRLGGAASIRPEIDSDGPRDLYVQSVDRAGNKSPKAVHHFYVRAGNGPLAQWSFEGNADDSAFLGDRHATPRGNTSYAPGAVGTSIQLDGEPGTDVSAPNTIRTDTSFSVSAWVRLDRSDGARVAVSQDGANWAGFDLWYRSADGGRWVFGMARSDDGAYGGVDWAWSATTAPIGGWNHQSAVYDAPGNQLRLYVNGVLSATAARTAPPWHAWGPLRIGQTRWESRDNVDPWQGAIDEVQVYDRALTADEVGLAVSRDNVQAGHWRFDEATEFGPNPGSTARNAVAGGGMGVLTNGATFSTTGAVNGAVRLDGTDDHVVTSGPVVRTDQSFSVAAWVNPRQFTTGGARMTAVSQDGTRYSSFYLQYNSELQRWGFAVPSTDDGATQWPGAVAVNHQPVVGVWTHLAATYDAATRQIQIFVNGELSGAMVLPGPAWHASGPLAIGRGRVDGGPAQHWPGEIDEVRMYSRVVSAEEIRGIMGRDNVTAGSWKLDGNTTDGSGNGRNGTTVGDPAWAAGQTSEPNPADLALLLDGDDFVRAPSAVDTNRSFAVAAWVRPDRVGNNTFLSQDGVHTSGFSVTAGADGHWQLHVATADRATPNGDWANGGSVQYGVWTHVAAVHSRERQRIELYINGVMVASAAHTTGFTAQGELQIGRAKWNDTYANKFAGAIDDVLIYNRPLFGDEIVAMAGRDLTLTHNWQLDENSGGIAADSIGVRRATVSGGATFGPGRTGNAVRLDGVDDAVSTAGVDLRTDQSLTVSAWVNLTTEDSTATAVSIDGEHTSKFRLGHVIDDDTNPFGSWVFEMPGADTQNPQGGKAALSTLDNEVDTWVHLVGVYDAPTRKLWLYVNGVRVADGTLNNPWPSSGGLQIGRGKVADAPAQFWPGSVDDVRLYTGPLDKDRISALYRSYPAESPPDQLPAADTGQWKFDENTGTAAADSSGRGRTATLRGGAGWLGGRNGYGAQFDGTSGYAETAVPVLNTQRSFSVAAWAYLRQAGGRDQAVIGQDGAQVSPFLLQYNAAANRWAAVVARADAAAPNVVTIASTEPVVEGQWAHVAAVYDADLHQVRLYVNGALSAVQVGVTVLAAPGPLSIGRARWNGANSRHFNGGLDDVRVFGKALTGGEVHKVHDDVYLGLHGYWRFNDDTVRDTSWRQSSTTGSGGVSFTDGMDGRALQLDGVSGALTSSSVGVPMLGSFTVAAWAKLGGTDRTQTVLGEDGTVTSGYVLQYRPERGRWVFGAPIRDEDGAGMVYAQSAQQATAGVWTHLAGVYDYPSRQLRLYVDGQLAGIRGNVLLWTAWSGFTIGRSKENRAPTAFFAGAIDEVTTDMGAASDADVAALAATPAAPGGQLGRFVNAAGDRYTDSTDKPVRPGYRFQSTLGVLATSQANTRMLYACRFNSDEFTSGDPNCEGQVRVGEIGRVYVTQPGELPTIPIYRCNTGPDHFDSRETGCEGATQEFVLGYTVAYAPVARYYHARGQDHWSAVDAVPPGFRLEGVLGWISLLPQTGTQALSACRDGSDEFTSLRADCEGKRVLGTLGHAWSQPGTNTTPLYRCSMAPLFADHFDSRRADCETRAVDGLLGHVLLAAPR